MSATTNQYHVNLRNLNIFHTWPSVQSERTLTIASTSDPNTQVVVTIPEGNWDAYGLAEYINEQIVGLDLTIEYDAGRLGFLFDPGMHIYDTTDCQDLLGFPDGYITGNTESVEVSSIPVRMSGPSRIHVISNLSLYTIPNSGRLATVPVTVEYGELLNYFDESGTQPSLCMDQHLNRIELELTDENGDPLPMNEEIPWGCVLSLDPVPNAGYESAQFFMRSESNQVEMEE